MRARRPSIGVIVAGALAAGLWGLTAPAGASPAPPPSVTPNPVSAGSAVTVSGAYCSTSDPGPVSVEVQVLNGSSQQIATGSTNQISDGEWTVSLTIPQGTAAGDYTVASSCDWYDGGYHYQAATLTVEPAPTPSTTAPASASASTTGAPSASPSTTSASISAPAVTVGGSVSVEGKGFTPGESVTVTLHSTPVQLTTWTADPSGAVGGTVTIPADTPVGAHTIELHGLQSGLDLTVALQVTDPVPVADSSSPLASTGTPAQGLLLAGLGLLALGILLSVGAWRLPALVSRRGPDRRH